MVADLNIPTRIRVMPTIREKDGLAKSSRNAYLSGQERVDAAIIWKSLRHARSLIASGVRSSSMIIRAMKKMLRMKRGLGIDYVAIVDSQNLKQVNKIQGQVLIALAVRIGRTRLIDNIMLRVGK